MEKAAGRGEIGVKEQSVAERRADACFASDFLLADEGGQPVESVWPFPVTIRT